MSKHRQKQNHGIPNTFSLGQNERVLLLYKLQHYSHTSLPSLQIRDISRYLITEFPVLLKASRQEETPASLTSPPSHQPKPKSYNRFFLNTFVSRQTVPYGVSSSSLQQIISTTQFPIGAFPEVSGWRALTFEDIRFLQDSIKTPKLSRSLRD